MFINQGTHTLQLYQPPVPEPSSIPFDDQPYQRDWERYGKNGKGTLRLYIFQGQPRPGSLTPSDMSDIDDEDTLPEVNMCNFSNYWTLCLRNSLILQNIRFSE